MVDRGTSRGVVSCAILCVASCLACSSGSSEPTAFVDNLPKTSWSSYGFDLPNTRASDDVTFSRDNVSQLVRKWEFPVKRCTANPAVVDGIVYFGDWAGVLYAKRAADGKDVFPPNRLTNGYAFDDSPTVAGDKIYIGDAASVLYAISRKTGKPVWSTKLDDHPSAHLFGSPVLVDGLVLTGIASQEVVSFGPYSFHGSLAAVDAETGNIVWKKFVTGPDAGSGGAGVSVWSSFAVDQNRKLAFIGTGQGYETPVSQYSDSLMAVHYDTGEFAWWRQYTANDVFTTSKPGLDYDIGMTPNLFSLPDGRDVVAVGDKGGRVAAFERETGNEAWNPNYVTVSPGSAVGGVMDSAAYHDGVLYGASNDGYTSIDDPQPADHHEIFAMDAATGQFKWKKTMQGPSVGGVTWANGLVFNISTDGTVYALDADTGDQLWSDSMADIAAAGPTVAHGRLFACHGFAFFKTVTGGAKIQGGIVAYGLP